MDDDQLGVVRKAPLQGVDVALAHLGPRIEQVGLREHHERRDAAGMDQRQIALEPAQVEVVVEPHDDQGPVDVADHRMPAAVSVASNDVRAGRHARVDPAAAVLVLRRQNPVADGERGPALQKRADEARPGPGRVVGQAVMKLHRLAVHGGDAFQMERRRSAGGAVAGAAGEFRREPDALKAVEVEVKHVETRMALHGRRTRRRRAGRGRTGGRVSEGASADRPSPRGSSRVSLRAVRPLQRSMRALRPACADQASTGALAAVTKEVLFFFMAALLRDASADRARVEGPFAGPGGASLASLPGGGQRRCGADAETLRSGPAAAHRFRSLHLCMMT